MFTVATLIIVLVAGLFIWGYDKYKQESVIAKAIDNSGAVPTLSEECQTVIKALTEKTGLRVSRYEKAILLPDGQKISYVTDDNFQSYSKLAWQPNKVEWRVMQGVVKKLYGNL